MALEIKSVAETLSHVTESHWFAGLAGSLVSLLFKSAPGTTLPSKMAGVAAGWACSFYFAPLLALKFSLAGGHASSVSFAVGMFAMLVVASMGSALGAMTKEDWLALWPFKKGGQ